MIIKDIRQDFFDKLKGRILLLCSFDVDSICSCKILQFLLNLNNSSHAVAPIGSSEELIKFFEEHKNSVDSVVLLNFGNLINIPQLLKPPDDLVFYVIDSHRPIDVYNYYKNAQVKLYINRRENDLNIPAKSKLFRKNDDGENIEDDEEDLALLNANPRDLTNEQLEKRGKLREWMIQKQRLLFDYQEFHYFERSISIIMYELACMLSKNNNYLLWLSIVGLCYQLKSYKITRDQFEKEAELVVRHIARNQLSKQQAHGTKWTISWEKDLNLDLYRKWTLSDSILHSPLTVCKFQLYNDKGQRNLLEFLVECGLALVQCKQLYTNMDLEVKAKLLEDISKVCLGEFQFKYNLQELVTRAFILRKPYRIIFSAFDYVMSLRALLESHDRSTSRNAKFAKAMESLSTTDIDLNQISQACETAKEQLKAMFEQVRQVINNQKIIDSGVFFHVDLQDLSAACKYFACGDSLMSFARFLLQAHVSSKSTRAARRAIQTPLIIVSPDYYDPEQIYIGGVPPLALESNKNFFRMAFEQAASNIDCEIEHDITETGLIKTSVNNKHALIEQIRVIME